MMHLGENVVDMVFTDSAVVPLPPPVKCFLQYNADVGIIMPFSLLSFMSDTSNLSPRPYIDCQIHLGMSTSLLASRDNSNQQCVNPLSCGICISDSVDANLQFGMTGLQQYAYG